MEQKIIVLRERTRRTRHRSRKDVRARRRICGVLAALCFLLLLGVVGGMENGTMALGIGIVVSLPRFFFTLRRKGSTT